jgi:hypothetical protein
VGLTCAGIIGKIDFGNGFVIAITARELVTTIHGRNIYRIKDVTIIPLTYDLAIGALRSAYRSNEESEDEAHSDEEVAEEGSDDSDQVDSTGSDSDESIIEAVLLKRPPGSTWIKWFKKEDSMSVHTGNVSDLIPKLLKCLKNGFSSGSFYFSYDLDLTSSLRPPPTVSPFVDSRDSFCFNRHIMKPFASTWLALPVIQGFIGSCEMSITTSKSPDTSEYSEKSRSTANMYLVSRRSVHRAGVRYLRRGIDDNGHCANWVETEQLLELEGLPIMSYLQVRGSLPIYFSQSPFNLQPVPKLAKSKEATVTVFNKHFNNLQKSFGEVAGISLVERSPKEREVGNAYAELAAENGAYVEWFDFHKVCRGMNFNLVETLFDSTVGQKLDEFGWHDDQLGKKQTGVFRVNCIDCLDRTNVVESTIAKRILHKQLQSHGLEVESSEAFETSFNGIWADNGDAVSKQYSSTNALKGDFTRTRQRNYKGVLTDAVLTLSRCFYGMVTDFFTQAVIDYLLGNVNEQVFEEFEEELQSTDPAIKVDSIRTSAIEVAASIVLSSDHEVLYGGWWILTPQKGTLRKVVLKDCIVLVTNCAVYVCDFDLETEKVVDFHRIPSRAISVIQTGSFFGEILSGVSRDPSRNLGVLLRYSTQGVTVASDKKRKRDANGSESYIAFKIPLLQSRDFAQIQSALLKSCPHSNVVEEDIVSLAQATSETGLWDRLEYHLKRVVWA